MTWLHKIKGKSTTSIELSRSLRKNSQSLKWRPTSSHQLVSSCGATSKTAIKTTTTILRIIIFLARMVVRKSMGANNKLSK